MKPAVARRNVEGLPIGNEDPQMIDAAPYFGRQVGVTSESCPNTGAT